MPRQDTPQQIIDWLRSYEGEIWSTKRLFNRMLRGRARNGFFGCLEAPEHSGRCLEHYSETGTPCGYWHGAYECIYSGIFDFGGDDEDNEVKGLVSPG